MTVKIFIASSAELKPEREQCILLINQINKSHKHLKLEPVEWEYDMPAGNVPEYENIQAAINPKLQESHIAVFLFYSRLGKYTLQEFELASREKKKTFAFFKSGFSPKKEQIKAYGELLEFREALNDTVLHLDFASEADFKNLILSNINLHLADNYSINSSLQSSQFSESLNTLIKLLAEKEAEIKELKLTHNKKSLSDVNRKLEKLEAEKENIRKELLVNQEMIEQLTKEKEELKQQLVPQIEHDALKARAFTEIENGNYTEAENYLKESAKDNIVETASTFYELGKLKKIQLQYNEALTYCELAVKIDPNNSLYLNEAGTILLTMGLYETAFNYFEKALLIDKKNYGEEHPDIAICYNNLGIAFDSKGEFDKAIEYFKNALAINKKNYGEEHPDIAICYNNLGIPFRKKGEFDKAIEYFESALAINKKNYGEEHQITSASYNNLGVIFEKRGDFEKAFEYFEKALDICKKNLGEEHPDIAVCYNNLGLAYKSKGEFDKAIECFENALTTDKKFLGEEHPNIAIRYNNLGMTFGLKKEFDKSIEYFKNALAISKKFLGEEHPDIAGRYNNLGIAYRNKNELYKAIKYYKKALEIGKKFFSANHSTIKTITQNLLIAKKAKEEN